MAADPNELLRQTRLKLVEGNFVLVGLSLEDGARLTRTLELVSRSDQPFMILQDTAEFSILIDEAAWVRLGFSAPSLKMEAEFRLVTLDQTLAWDVVGYLARVTAILAAEGISVGVLSSFSRDHLLIKQNALDGALRVLTEAIGQKPDAV